MQNERKRKENGYQLFCVITTILTTDVYLLHINIITICLAYKEKKLRRRYIKKICKVDRPCQDFKANKCMTNNRNERCECNVDDDQMFS